MVVIMQLDEAKQILNKNGYLLEDKYMDDLDTELDDIINSKPITVDHIDRNNYKDYIGRYVNVTGDVDLYELGLTELPIRFGKVGGDFLCGYNKLTSLKGAPKEVGGDFVCRHNKIKFIKIDVLAVSKVNGKIYC